KTQYKYLRNENLTLPQPLIKKDAHRAMRWTFKYSEHSLCAEAHFRTERLEVDAAIVDAHLLELLQHCAHEAHGSADVDLSVLCIFEVLFVQEAFSFAEFDFEVSALFPDCRDRKSVV